MLSRTAPVGIAGVRTYVLGSLSLVGPWEADDPAYSRPIVAPLERCAELLGVDLAIIQRAAADIEPYIRADGTKVWSLMQLERRLRPEAYGRGRGGYVRRRRRIPPVGA
jgi:transcriptional regulator with XRE-family HTH domain